MLKKIIIMGAIMTAMLALPKIIKSGQERKPAIAILQTASHPALDLVQFVHCILPGTFRS